MSLENIEDNSKLLDKFMKNIQDGEIIIAFKIAGKKHHLVSGDINIAPQAGHVWDSKQSHLEWLAHYMIEEAMNDLVSE